MRKRVALLAFALVAGCGGPKEAPPKATYAPPPPVVDAWVLGTRDARAEEPALLWNGLIGVRVNRDGSGAENGFFAIDEYDVEGEEKIRALPNPLGTGTKGLLDPNRPYEQNLDMRSGVLTTRYTRTDGVQVTFEHVMHPTRRMIAERVTYTGGDRKTVVTVPATPAVPTGLIKVTSMQFWGDKAAPTDPNAVEVPAKERVLVERTISFGKSGNQVLMREADRQTSDLQAGWNQPETPLGYNDVYQASLEVWRKRWQTDIEIDGPAEDQQAIRSFLFYLRSAIHRDGDMSISPFALSDTQYNGHVFWDADIWVFPALAFIDPAAAKEISEYRLRLADQAQLNAYGGAMPNEKAKAASMTKFPWESSVSGKETVPGPSQKEIHITGSVLWALSQSAALGFIPEDELAALVRSAATMYRARKVDGDQGWELQDVMSPDENHIGSNDLYTNLLANWLENRSQGAKGKDVWQPTPYKLPKDDQTFLTYDNDRLRGYKQAAAVLSIYPLQYPPAEKQARAMMDRFADKVIKNGPAMTDSVHSVIWSRLGEREKGYAAWKASWEPFTRHPLMLFSEKRVRSKTYFTTGAGGALQSVLYGFAGMRLDWQKEPGSAWSTRLRGDNWLSIKPNLPPSWKSLKFRNFTVDGRRYSLSVSSNAVQVVPGG